jgi:hypothetical protein
LEVSMSTTSTAGSSRIGTTVQNRSLLPSAATGAVVAALVNAALWAGGRAADVSFSASPPLGDSSMQVGIVLIVPTTLFMFGIGIGLLVLAARRSRAWVRAVVVAAALFTVASVSGPLSTADDTASGVLLALMHVVTGAAFLVTASRVAAR